MNGVEWNMMELIPSHTIQFPNFHSIQFGVYAMEWTSQIKILPFCSNYFYQFGCFVIFQYKHFLIFFHHPWISSLTPTNFSFPAFWPFFYSIFYAYNFSLETIVFFFTKKTPIFILRTIDMLFLFCFNMFLAQV
jgi:hypothetical protein